MKASPLVLMLEALVSLLEQRLDPRDGAACEDVLLIGKQLNRLNGLYIRLVEAALEAATRDRVRE